MFYLKNFQSYENQYSRQMFCKSQNCVQCIIVSTEDRTPFSQESIDNNTQMSNSDNYKETQDVSSFQTDFILKSP